MYLRFGVVRMNLNRLPIRRMWVIKREFKVHVFSTLIWWSLFCGLVVIGPLFSDQPIPWRLMFGALPLIAILEAVFFVASILRR